MGLSADTASQKPASHPGYLVIGAGALGTYIGGSLALAGDPVTFLERPETAEELSQRGAHLTISGKKIRVPLRGLAGTMDRALQFGPFEAAIFALKSYDTEKAIESLKPHKDDLPPILCLQNGVDNEEVLEAALGEGRVIAGTVTSSVRRIDAGEVVLERLRGVGIAASHPKSAGLAQAMNQAGLMARLYESAMGMKWSKMITNLLANATCAILDMTPGEVFAHPGLYGLEAAQIREALRVMKAQGLEVVDLPATPVRLLSLAMGSLPNWLSRQFVRRGVGGGRGGKMPSFHIDLRSGSRQSEVDYLNGAVVRHGSRLEIPTPTNRLLTETLMKLTKGEIPLDMYRRKPEGLLAEWRGLIS